MVREVQFSPKTLAVEAAWYFPSHNYFSTYSSITYIELSKLHQIHNFFVVDRSKSWVQQVDPWLCKAGEELKEPVKSQIVA